MLDTVSAGRM